MSSQEKLFDEQEISEQEHGGELRESVGEEMLFANASGRETQIEIRDKERIAAGSFGDIYRADTRVLGNDGNYKDRTFVLKQFKETDFASAKEAARHSFEMYSLVKESGVHTWPTYRIDKNTGTTILMSDGELGGSYLISQNESHSKTNLERSSVTEIEHFDEAVADMIKSCIALGNKGLVAAGDAWLGRFTPTSESQKFSFEYFIGDFDDIQNYALEVDHELTVQERAQLGYRNIENMAEYLSPLLYGVFSDSNSSGWEECRATLEDRVQKSLDALNEASREA